MFQSWELNAVCVQVCLCVCQTARPSVSQCSWYTIALLSLAACVRLSLVISSHLRCEFFCFFKNFSRFFFFHPTGSLMNCFSAFFSCVYQKNIFMSSSICRHPSLFPLFLLGPLLHPSIIEPKVSDLSMLGFSCSFFFFLRRLLLRSVTSWASLTTTRRCQRFKAAGRRERKNTVLTRLPLKFQQVSPPAPWINNVIIN